MNPAFPLLLALSAGFAHAFEADHLVAVSSLVTRRATARLAVQDGIFWGLGHTSTLLLVSSVYLLGRFVLRAGDFRYLEAGVGLMLVGLGSYRLWKVLRQQDVARDHNHGPPAFSLAYGVGMMHGLAGSGALLLSVLTQLRGTWNSLAYLLVFGLGSVGGMMVAAGAFSLPFSTRFLDSKPLRQLLTLLSALVCLGLGLKIVYENLHG